MKTVEIFHDIKNTFGDLWQYRERGNTLEIITPYATTNNSFVSVFFTIRGNEYIFSDGGWLETGEYGFPLDDNQCFQKLFDHFLDAFSILQTTAKDGTNYFYTKTNSIIDIPSRIFDFALFIQGIVNATAVQFADERDNNQKKRFVSKANNFIKEYLDSEKLQMNAYLIPDNEDIKFNAIFNDTPNTMMLLNYVTGSTHQYFLNSISKTNILFEMAENSFQKQYISEKVSLIDDSAEGYNEFRTASFISHLKFKTGSKIVPWSRKKELISIFN